MHLITLPPEKFNNYFEGGHGMTAASLINQETGLKLSKFIITREKPFKREINNG